MNNETLGSLLAILTAIISGVSIIANKFFVATIDPFLFTAIRALFIGLVFFIICFYSNKFSFKGFNSVSWKYLLAIGIIGGGLAFLLFFSGLKLTTGGRAAFLHKTLPFFTLGLAYFFLKEKVKKYLPYLLAMFIGIIFIVFTKINPTEFFSNPQLGDLLILGATFLWAIEITISKKAMNKGESNWIISFSRMFIGAIVLFGFIGIFGKFNLLLQLNSAQIIKIIISTALLFAYIFCWYWSIKLIDISKATSFLLLAPVISLILGILIFKEPLGIVPLLGSFLILIGAYKIGRIKSTFVTE